MIHVDRPYGLTSFVQQAGRGGRDGEVRDSIVIVRVKTTNGGRRSGILREYSVEQVDEDAMTEFIPRPKCRRVILSRYFDGSEDGTDCQSVDGVFCDRCTQQSQRQPQIKPESQSQSQSQVPERPASPKDRCRPEPDGREVIAARLAEIVRSNELVIEVMDRFKRGCIHCELEWKGGKSGGPIHTYEECVEVEARHCAYPAYQKWRETVDLGECSHCWKCGLSQTMCRGLEKGIGCEYPDIMLPAIYILHQKGHLPGAGEIEGFQGEYCTDLWEWMSGVAEGFGSEHESNWIQVWRRVCSTFFIMYDQEESP